MLGVFDAVAVRVADDVTVDDEVEVVDLDRVLAGVVDDVEAADDVGVAAAVLESVTAAVVV